MIVCYLVMGRFRCTAPPLLRVACYVMCIDILTAIRPVTERLQPAIAEHSNSLPCHCICRAGVPLLLVGT